MSPFILYLFSVLVPLPSSNINKRLRCNSWAVELDLDLDMPSPKRAKTHDVHGGYVARPRVMSCSSELSVIETVEPIVPSGLAAPVGHDSGLGGHSFEVTPRPASPPKGLQVLQFFFPFPAHCSFLLFQF